MLPTTLNPGFFWPILVLLGGSALSAQTSDTRSAASARLLEITETRHTVVSEPEPDENEMTFSMSMQVPALSLTFALDLPQDLKLLKMEQPRKVRALDSTGRDLSDIEPAWNGELEFVEAAMMYDGEAPKEFTFQLDLPAREAKGFSVHAEFEAIVYDRTQLVEVELGPEWTDLDPALFGGRKVKARFGSGSGFFGDAVGIELRPVEAREAIESVEFVADNETFESGSSMWDDQMIVYTFFEEPDAKSGIAKLLVRTGIRAIPVRVEMENQPLR